MFLISVLQKLTIFSPETLPEIPIFKLCRKKTGIRIHQKSLIPTFNTCFRLHTNHCEFKTWKQKFKWLLCSEKPGLDIFDKQISDLF